MKSDCRIVKDLMPLVLDGAASEESKQLVLEHVEDCPDCRDQYALMRAALPDAGERTAEDRSLVTALKRTRRTKLLRLLRTVALAVAAALVLTAGVLFASQKLCYDYGRSLSARYYTADLSLLKSGDAVVNVRYQGVNRYTILRVEGKIQDGRYAFILRPSQQWIDWNENPQDFTYYRVDQKMLEDVDVVFVGETPVWEKGDEIPAASEAMETYFDLDDEMTALNEELAQALNRAAMEDTPEAWLRYHTQEYENLQKSEALACQIQLLRTQVPEWQGE